MRDMARHEINLRHLRLLFAVSQTGSVTAAARQCHISQPAVSQALKNLETYFGLPLFERSANGVFTNAIGTMLADRVARALELLDTAAAAFGSGLHLTASTARLRALVEMAQTENFSMAARNLGVAQPTVHRAVTQLEEEVGRALFRRTQYGSIPTRQGQQLAQAAQLAFAELAQAEAEIAQAVGKGSLSMTIGAMPLSRSFLLPDAIAAFQATHPQVSFRIVEGPYDTLLAGLRRAQIDLLVGALRSPPPADDVVEEHLFDDELIIVSDPRHPLAESGSADLAAALDYPWIVANPGAPARQHFDAQVKAAGGPAPSTMVETSSMILMRELLHKGRYLGVISRLQAECEIRNGLMTALPIAIEDSKRAIGLTLRSNWRPTNLQQNFLDLIRSRFQAP